MLVTTDWLAAHLNDPDVIVADVRWSEAPPPTAEEKFHGGHIPGAVFLDLDTDLSDRTDLRRGRHPLPPCEAFVETLTRIGVGQGTQLVVYDDRGSSIAVRLWWMMRWIGAPETAVLDGGLDAWMLEGRDIEGGPGRSTKRAARPLVLHLNPNLVAGMEEVESMRPDALLLDARAPERYRGEVEPIDARPGHIPGAVNAPWTGNLADGDGKRFKSPAELHARFAALGATPESPIICYCGSGVTACHNLLALDLAGFRHARLYPGSWSEWIVHHP